MSQRLPFKLFSALLLLNILPWGCALAQTNYQFTRYTQEDGLVSSSVTEIVKDKTGFLWLMSENGLMRFDGYEFKVFRPNSNDQGSLPASNFYEMKVDEHGNAIVRTIQALCKYVPASSSFKKIIPYSDSIRINEWIDGADAQLWATSRNQLLRIDGAKETYVKYNMPVSFDKTFIKLATDRLKYVWLYNQKNQMLCFDISEGKFSPVRIQHYDSSSELLKNVPRGIFNDPFGNIRMLTRDGLYKYNDAKKIFSQYNRSSLNNDKKNNYQCDAIAIREHFFIGTNNGNLIRINMNDGTEKSYSLKESRTIPGEPDFVFNKMVASQDGSVWISTLHGAVFHFFPGTETWEQLIHHPENQNSLLSNSVDFIFEDLNNVIWINCPGRGIVKAEPLKPILSSFTPSVNHKSLQGSQGENVRTIIPLNTDHLLIGTLGSLLAFNTSAYAFLPVTSPVDGKPILTNKAISNIIADSSGNFWISEWGTPAINLVSYKNKIFKRVVPDSAMIESFMTIRSMFLDSRRFLWAGTSANIIYHADMRSFNPSYPEKIIFDKFKGGITNSDTLIFSNCFSIVENADKNILFGTENGLYEFNYATEKFKRFENRPGDSKSLSDNNVRALCVDREGTLWLGTVSGGLNRFDKATQTFSSFTMKNGLPDNSVYSILEDNKGFLWLGTNKGLCRFNTKNKSCRNYSLKDGIQNYEYNTNGACKTSTGELAFGGRTGFNFFNPDSMEIFSDAPAIAITRFNVFDREMQYDTNEIKLNYDENSLSFQFAALNFFRNKENQYAYKLDGLENDWIYCGDRRFTNYASLPPGKYVFHVKASNCFGVWNETGAMIKFSITAPWWKTWWFRISVAMAITIIIFILFRLRLQQKLKLQAVRNRIARDLHDEIGSNLSSIILFSEVAKQKTKDSEHSVFPLLKKISDYTQTSQEAINDIVWMINSRNDSFENIIIRMRSLAAEMFEAKQINFNLNIDDKLNHLKMGMDKRKNFYLIYKETINNIVKYAACRQVNIDLTYRHSAIFLTIKDDGVGFDSKNKSKGNGLINMQKRAEMLDGKLALHTEPGKGTTVELRFAI